MLLQLMLGQHDVSDDLLALHLQLAEVVATAFRRAAELDPQHFSMRRESVDRDEAEERAGERVRALGPRPGWRI